MKTSARKQTARPAGFNRPAKRAEKKNSAEAEAKQKKRVSAKEKARARAAEKALRAKIKLQRRLEKEERRAERAPGQKRGKGGLIAVIAAAAILLALAAIMIFGDHNAAVHQMPTILRESAEGEFEPEAGSIPEAGSKPEAGSMPEADA